MMAPSNLVRAAAQVTAERMLESLLIGVALAVFAWALLRVLPRPNAATRFAVWFTALVGTAFLPLLYRPHALLADQAPPPLFSVPGSWATYLCLAWGAITLIALLRVVLGLVELRRIRRSCRAIENLDAGWQVAIAHLCPARQVKVLTSDRIHVPTAIGFFRPAVIIPAELLAQLSPAQLTHVLLHELAHLRRWDDWTNLVQKCLKALLFFHPAVWWMEARISLEREMACDDAVLAETSSPRAYAECLATLAEKSLLRRSAALAQAAVNRVRQTTLRVAQILDVNRPEAAPARKSAVALVAVFATVCLAVAWQMPRLVGFQDTTLPEIAGAKPAPLPKSAIPAGDMTVAPRPIMAKRQAAAPQVIQAKFAGLVANASEPQARHARPRLAKARPGPVEAASEPRIIQASAKAATYPAVTTGVLVIMVDDPDFGPMPVVYRFAIWHAAPAPPAEQAAPQKTT